MREKIANRQFTYILFMMRTTVIIATLPVLTSGDAWQDAWVAGLLTLGATTAAIVVIAALGGRHPDKSVVQMAETLLGPWLGKVLSLVILWAYLHLAAISVRLYAEMVVIGFLPEAPLLFVIGGMVAVAAYAAHQGIEVIGRVADIFFFIMLLFILGSLVAVIPEMRWENLEPVMARGWSPAARGTMVPLAVGAELLVVGMMVPALLEPEKAAISAAWAVLAAGVMLTLVAFMVVAVASAEVGREMVFPFLSMIRAIEITEFIDRIEVLVVLAWGLGVFVGFATFIFAGARGLADLLHLADYRFLVAPMGIHWTFLGLHVFDDMFQIREFSKPDLLGVYGIGLMVVPYGVLWLAHLLRKGGQR